MDKIIVHNQQEMNAVPDDYGGRIIIEGKDVVVLGYRIVELYEESTAVLYNNASAILHGNAFVSLYNDAIAYLHDKANAVLYDESIAILHNNATAELHNNTTVELHDNAIVYLYDEPSAVLYGKSIAYLHGNASAYLYGKSIAFLHGNASAELHDNAIAYLYGTSSVYLYDIAIAVLYDNTTAEQHGNSQVLDQSDGHNIKLYGNARVVYLPRNIDEYLDYFGVKHTKDMATLYKAVRKTNDGKYVSNHDMSFEYIIGEYKTEKCDTDITQSCSYGIHIAPLDWVLQYGGEWNDLAILEVETSINDIILPENTNGKIRTTKVKVIREVPLEECGVLGKMIARKQRRLS